jgi:L-fucose isomerase
MATLRTPMTSGPPFAAEPYHVGILSFSDGRLRVYDSLVETVNRHAGVLAEAIRQDPLLRLLEPAEIVHSVGGARLAAKQMRSRDAEAAVFNIPVFAFSNFSLLAARILEMPVLLSSPRDGTLPGLGGILAAHGAMAQVGLKSRKMWGNPLEEPALQTRLSAFCRASGAVARLKGSVYGLIGGRSMGMNTGVANPQDWMRQFGVDTEQIDQLELVRRARTVDEEEVERAYAWMVTHMGRVSTERKAAPEHVKEQIRHYIALRGIIEENGLDFIGIKCHYDLSEYIVTACVSAMCFNDPYDWNGPKAPFVVACEADSDGALTMQILKLISGYPSLLFDIRHYDRECGAYVCCNCGAQPSWYAARSNEPDENLARVFLEPVISKYAGGGAHFPYVCKEGEITLARLSRVDNRYRMFVARGEFIDQPRAKLAETCASWPHGFVKMNIEPEDFISRFDTNHAHVIPGAHTESLEIYCDLMEIPVDKVS